MKAIILAGGQGTRLRGLGEVLPKCLLPVFDRPLLFNQLEQCELAGASEVLVSVSSRFESLVTAVLRSWRPPGDDVAVRCVAESIPLGPVGGLLALQPLVGDEGVLVMLGDMYFENPAGFVRLRERRGAGGIDIGIIRRSPPDRILCNVVLDGAGNVLHVREKPHLDEITGDVRWCGVVRFGLGAFAAIPEEVTRPEIAPGDALDWMRRLGAPMAGVEFEELEINLNTPENVLVASCVEALRRDRSRNSDRKARSDVLRELGAVAVDLLRCAASADSRDDSAARDTDPRGSHRLAAFAPSICQRLDGEGPSTQDGPAR